MRLAQHLTEAKIELSKTKHSESDYAIRFVVDGTPYVFYVVHGNREYVEFEREDNPGYDLVHSGKYAGGVFTGFIQALKMWIKEKNIKEFGFSTSEQKLKKVYNGLLKKKIEKETGFKLKEHNDYGFVAGWVYTK